MDWCCPSALSKGDILLLAAGDAASQPRSPQRRSAGPSIHPENAKQAELVPTLSWARTQRRASARCHQGSP